MTRRFAGRDWPIPWMLYCAGAALTLLVYVAVSARAGQGDVLMPLDDAYIHFQYARQMAAGEPYVYNPGDEPTSGATSFIYPYVLAAGYLLGFHGLALGLWAMGVGAVALAVCAEFVRRISRALGVMDWLAAVMGLLLLITGSAAWHAMSGMETALVMLFALATLLAFVELSPRGFALTGSLLALSRPEGSLMAIIAVVMWLARDYSENRRNAASNRRDWPLLLLPVLACGVQPTLNWLLTGSFSASGQQAKSILGMVPFAWDVVIDRVADNFIRMWRELATGTGGDYMALLLPLLALIALVDLLRHKDTRWTGLLVLGWLVAITAAVATLDTAFWHFKRYQMPLMLLLFPLAAVGIQSLGVLMVRRAGEPGRATYRPRPALLLILALVLLTLPTWGEFLRLYRVNVDNIADQPLAMARWLQANTPEDAVVAVHDVGMMRYIGNRTTVDMVGLTGRGAADAWRNGPGAVGEYLMAHDPRPDYVAAYTTARGLNYLADTGIYGELLAGFSAEYDPADNVALGAEFQGIFRPDWSRAESGDSYPLQGGALAFYVNDPSLPGPAFVADTVDVADLDSEGAHSYTWEDNRRAAGFTTEVYEFDYIACPTDFQHGQTEIPGCTVIDGGRRISGAETFRLEPQVRGTDAVLITRLHPASRGTFAVYVNGVHAGTRVIPEVPGRWLEVPTYIPAELVDGPLDIRIVTDVPGGYYMPYRHWLMQGFADTIRPWREDVLVTFQDGAIQLVDVDVVVQDETLTVQLGWQSDGRASGDYVVLLHVYDDIDNEPVVQTDLRPGAGALPPGNWLPRPFSDTFVVDLGGVPPGQYTVMIGLYAPDSLERLVPDGVRLAIDESSRRVFIGMVDIP